VRCDHSGRNRKETVVIPQSCPTALWQSFFFAVAVICGPFSRRFSFYGFVWRVGWGGTSAVAEGARGVSIKTFTLLCVCACVCLCFPPSVLPSSSLSFMPFFFSKKKRDTDADRQKRSIGSDEEANIRIQVEASSPEPVNSRADDSRSITPRRTQRRGSLNESSGWDDSTDTSDMPVDHVSGEQHHHNRRRSSQHVMPPIKNGSTSNNAKATTQVGSSSSSSDVAAADSLLVNEAEIVTHIPRGNTVTIGMAMRRSSGKVKLPRLASAQSLPSDKVTPNTSLTPIISTSLSMYGKPSLGSVKPTSRDDDDASLTPMKRYPASDPASVPPQPLQRSPAEHLRSSTGGSVGSKKSFPSAEVCSLPAHPALVQPVRIAADITTPDAKKTKSAAEVTGTSSSFSSLSAAGAAAEARTPAPAFTAMESVPKRPGSSFRLQKRRKGGPDGMPGDAAKSDNSSISFNNGSNGSISPTAGLPTQPATSVFDATRTERQANGSGSSHGRRREPVTSFTDAADTPSQRPSASALSGSFNVPLPPPLSTDDLAPHRSKSPNKHQLHRNSSLQNSTAPVGDTDSLDQTPSVRRSRRSSMRSQHAPHSAGSMRNTSVSSCDDIPRPLTRHASTLSNDQREALKKTPSFLSRVHTPPPSDLRESVQLRRVRRPSLSEGLPSDTPPVSTSRTRADISMTSDSTALLSDASLHDHAEQHCIASPVKTMTAEASMEVSPSPQPEKKDASISPAPTGVSSGMSSFSASFPSTQVRPASRAPRSLTSATPDIHTSLPSPTSAAAADKSSTTPAAPSSALSFPSVPAARPSSARSSQQRQRRGLLQKSSPPLSLSPEPTTAAKKPEGVRPAAVSSEQANPVASNGSVFSSEAELFDYYGSFMLTAPQFDRTSGHLLPSPPPADEKPAADTKSTTKANVEEDRPTPPPTTASKKSGTASSSFASDLASLGDVLPNSPVTLEPAKETTGTTTTTKPKAEVRPPAPANKPSSSASSLDHGRGVRPAGRQRQVSTYIDEDDDDMYHLASDKTAKTKESSSRTDTAAPGYDYLMDSGTLVKDARSAAAATTTPSPTTVPVPAKRLVAQQLPASVAVADAASMSKLSSSDEDSNEDADEEDEEDVEGLLEGFRPALFDAARRKRRGSSILFYLNKEDSLSSLDVIVKPGNDGRLSTAKIVLSPLVSGKAHSSPSSSQQQQQLRQQSEYSMLKVSSTSPLSGGSANEVSGAAPAAQLGDPAATDGVARPRVTMEPYVPLGSNVGRSPMPPAPPPASACVESRVSKSFSLLMDPYGLQLDSSNPSLPAASVPRLTKKASVSRRTVMEGPVSIFVATTARFAPDPKKMHRPLANTFGYTAAQRRSRAAAMAAGVSLEEWENASGIDDTDEDDDDGKVYKEVYTDENGDEWYWEEVEEGEDEEYEEEMEEGEEVEDEGGPPEVPKTPLPASTSALTTA
jgi:hypothetical protein